MLEEIERAPDDVRATIAEEVRRLPLVMLEESQESLALARAYVEAGAIPPDYEDDARHVAVATVNDVRVVVSWNWETPSLAWIHRVRRERHRERAGRPAEPASPAEAAELARRYGLKLARESPESH